jgi:hypothetical protein
MGDTIMGIGKLGIEKDNLLEARRIQREGMEQDNTYKQGMLQQGQQRIDLEAEQVQQNRLKMGLLNEQYTPSAVARATGKVKSLGLDKALQPEIEMLREMGQSPEYTMEKAHTDFVSIWPQKREDIIHRLQDDVSNKIAKNPNYENTPEGKKASALMDGIYADQNGEQFANILFPGVGEAKAFREANSKAALEAARQDKDFTLAPGAIRVDASGRVIKSNPKPLAEEKKETEAEKRLGRKEIADAEVKIRSNMSNEAVAPLVDVFNERAEKPYAFVWKQNKYLPGGEFTPVKLPVIKGKQATAAEVYYTAQSRGMTIEQVIEQLTKGK